MRSKIIAIMTIVIAAIIIAISMMPGTYRACRADIYDIDYDRQETVYVDDDGELWNIMGVSDCQKGILIFDKNRTETIYDDEIVCVIPCYDGI